jgi:hypothetical protein
MEAYEIPSDKVNLNYLLWQKKLDKYGCYSDSLIEELGDKLRDSAYSLTIEQGGAYQGAMIDICLNTLCRIGFDINRLALGANENNTYRHPYLSVNQDMLMKVLLLQHISKAEIFVPETEQWRQKNGYNYKFNDESQTMLRTGERSIYLCMKYGIKLNELEFEAMRIIDKDDAQINYLHLNPLSCLVKMVNHLATIEIRERVKSLNV